MDEKQVLELFLLTGTEEAFCALFEALYPRVRRYFVLRGLDRMAAEDLAQNVMFIVYRRAAEVRDRGLFNGWLMKVARNELLQHWRRQPPPEWMVAFEPLSGSLGDQLSAPTVADEASHFAEWMTFLEPAERELVRLRFIEELSYDGLALALDVPVGTVKWRLFNVRKKLSHIISRTSRDTVSEYPRKREL